MWANVASFVVPACNGSLLAVLTQAASDPIPLFARSALLDTLALNGWSEGCACPVFSGLDVLIHLGVVPVLVRVVVKHFHWLVLRGRAKAGQGSPIQGKHHPWFSPPRQSFASSRCFFPPSCHPPRHLSPSSPPGPSQATVPLGTPPLPPIVQATSPSY